MTIHAIINLQNSSPVSISITTQDGQTQILDAMTGQPYRLPSGVTVDSAGNLIHNNSVVGNIVSDNLAAVVAALSASSTLPFSSAASSGSTTAGAASSSRTPKTQQQTIDNGVVSNGDTPQFEEAGPPESGMPVTATQADAGWRLGDEEEIPSEVPPEETEEEGSGDSGGGGGEETQDSTPGEPDPRPEFVTPGSGSRGPGSATPPATAPTGGGMGIMGAVGLAGTAAGLLKGTAVGGRIAGALGKFANGNVGGVAGGAGVFLSMMMMGKNGVSAGGIIGAVGSAALMYVSFGPWGLAAAAIIALAGWLVGRYGLRKEQEVDLGKGDVDWMPGTNAGKGRPGFSGVQAGADYWYNRFPSESVYFILAGAALLGSGIDLSSRGALNQRVEVAVSEVPIRLSKDVKNLKDAIKQDPPDTLDGKVFVQRGDYINNPDKVVFYEKTYRQDGAYNGYAINSVSLNKGGYLVSPQTPDSAREPFFLYDPETQKIKRNPKAVPMLTAQQALTRAAPRLSPRGAAVATHMAAMEGRHNMRQVPSADPK